MAAGALVLETAVYAKLVDEAGGTDKVSGEALVKAALVESPHANFEQRTFKSGGQEYRFRMAVRKPKDAVAGEVYLYSIASVKKVEALDEVYETLVSVGELAKEHTPKAEWRKEPFVVLIHYGNYLTK